MWTQIRSACTQYWPISGTDFEKVSHYNDLQDLFFMTFYSKDLIFLFSVGTGQNGTFQKCKPIKCQFRRERDV